MSFAALPPVPISGLTDAEYQLLVAIHENIALLTGQGFAGNRAIVSGQVTVTGAPDATVSGVSISGSPNDLANTALALQYLINDVQSLRDTLNALITQLRS